MLKQLGFLGTGATLGADLTLTIQIIFFLTLCIGILLQLRHKYRGHDLLQTPVVVLNLFFIIFIMVVSFRESQIASTLPSRPGDPFYLAAGVHAILGIVTEALAIYCLLAGFKILPRKIGALKYFMRTTFVLWTITLLFGLTTYYVWYVRKVEAVTITDIDNFSDSTQPLEPGAPPPPRRVNLQNFAFTPQEITVVAGTKMIWVNQDAAPHNVAFEDNSVASDNFTQGEAFEHTFRATGTFVIYCTLHGNPGSGMTSVVTVVEPTEENVAELAAEPVEMDAQPPPPTPAPPVPPAPVTLIEPPEPDDVVSGIMAFRDNVAPNDSVLLAMSGVEVPPDGMEMYAWLTTSSSNEVLNIGRIGPDPEGKIFHIYADPARQNLMALYDGVQVTLEPIGDSDPAPGEVIFSGRQAPHANDIIREITVSAPDTPNNVGYGIGGRMMAEEVIRHALFLKLAFDLGSIADAQRHAEHIVNLIEGTQGEFYGDHDGAHGVQDPGDGYGVIPYINGMVAAAQQAAAADDTTLSVSTHAGHVSIAGDSALFSAETIRTNALLITEANNVTDIGEYVEAINTFSQRLLLGEDEDGDGNISLAEGGIFIGYQHSQYMGAVGIIAGADAAVVDPTVNISEAGQTTGNEVIVNMIDFEYSLPSLTVPEGTTVRFINKGESKHSVTADDGSFDSGLLNKDGEFDITFDQTGFVPYFCVLHGTQGNTGMSGSVTVVGKGEEVPEPVEPEPAEVEPAPPEAQQFSIEMVDFDYSEHDFVVPVGSEVTWFNTGAAQHSATSADNIWDTTLLANGEQATVTFDTPGTYIYYCLLHGTPDGQGMAATITVVDGDAAQPPPEEPTEEPTEQPTEEVPTPEPTESPPEPEEVSVSIVDFTYEPVELTITPGTTVIWNNVGDFDHSATADDGSWDTEVFGPGGSKSITFDTPGVYQFYCQLHGTPDGNGMVGTVIVTEE
ncbi:MAG: plastocyanin/azurin family copper-binding protein [Candidatus Promineifilaceae bacterium]